jgi:hypothetical protein
MTKHILNDTTLRNVKPGANAKRLNDGGKVQNGAICLDLSVDNASRFSWAFGK